MDFDSSHMTQDELDKILEAHKKWLNGEKDGVRANLHGTFLRNVNLYNANLSGADLMRAHIRPYSAAISSVSSDDFVVIVWKRR